jgi:hypothetical protein
VVFYAIEKQDSEWVVYVHGAPILRCARPDIAQEIVRTARALLGEAAPDHALLGETPPRARLRGSGA